MRVNLRQTMTSHPTLVALFMIAMTAPLTVMGFSRAALWVDQSRIRRIASFEDETRRRMASEFQELGRVRVQRLRQVAAGMLNNPDPDSRVQAIYALAALAGSEFRARIESALMRDADPVVRFTAALFLQQIGGQASIPVLCDALEDPSRLVRWAAARALGFGRLADAFPLVVWHLRADDPDRPFLLELAVQSSIGPSDILYWMRMLESSVPSDRRIACMALAFARVRSVCDNEVAMRLRDPDPTVRAASCVALGLLGSRVYASRMLPLTLDSDPRVRANVIRAMGMLGVDGAFEVCQEVLRSSPAAYPVPERPIRVPRLVFRTKEGLVRKLPFKIERSMFLPGVPLDWPGIEERDVRFAAVIGLLGLSDAGTGPLLLSLLQDRNPRVAEAAILGIRTHDTEQTFHHMSKIVLDSDRPASARKVAAKWLGEAEPDRSLPVLISAYESATGGIRENVAMDDFIREVVIQIGRFRSAKSIEVLEQSVRYPNPAVRSAGVRALGSLANREAIDVLEDVWAHDHDQTINDAALRELTRLRAMMDR